MKKKMGLPILLIALSLVMSGCGNTPEAVENDSIQNSIVKEATVENKETEATAKPIEETKDETTKEETKEETAKDETTKEEITDETKKKDHSGLVLYDIELAEDGTGKVVYDGVNHDIILNLPETVEGAPLVLMLHGYGESASAFRQKTSFDADANPLGYVVAYVTGATTPEDATSSVGWNSGIGISGNEDVDFLCALANDLCNIYSLDGSRVFAVGFSNGAFMTHRLAVEANDIFAAVVSVAGMMPEKIWLDRPTQCQVGILQITGEKDDVVPKNSDGSAKFSKSPAIEDVMEYYVDKNNASLQDTVSIGKKATLEKYISSDAKKQVWNIFIPDGRHSWPDETIVGFSTNRMILEFLETE